MPLFVACLAVTLASKIDLSTRGETVAALLKEASAAASVTMESTPQTRDEIVIASLKGATVEEFRSHLAKAIGAQWKQEGGAWRLTRPLELEKAQQRSERQHRVADAKVGIATLKKQLADQTTFNEATAQALAAKVASLYTKFRGHLSDGPGLTATTALVPESPAGRLSIEAVGMLSAEQIADVGQGDRIVYSTNPTRMQRPMPGNLSKAIARYVAEQTLYSKALQHVAEGSGWEDSWSPLLGRSNPEIPTGLLLSTAHSPYNGSLTVDVMLVGSDGSYVGRMRSLLDLDSARTATAPIRDEKVPLSPSAQRFYEATQQLTKGKTFIDDPKLLAEMAYPEQHDPLSYVAADGLLDLADGKNVIACIPDDGFTEPTFSCLEDDGKLNLAKFSRWLTGTCQVTQEPGWMVATPLSPVHTRETRADRAVFGPFFRQARKNGGASLADILDIMVKLPTNYMESLVPYMAFFLLPDLNAAISDRNIEMLRVLGRLTPDQRRDLLAGRPFPVGQMSLASHIDLNHLIYRADSPISVSYSGPPPASRGFQGSLETEVTNAMPNGVPEDGMFSIGIVSNDVVITDGGDTPASNYQPQTAWQIGSMVARAETADASDPRQRFRVDRYRFGTSRRYDFRLTLSPQISLHSDLRENQIPRDKPSIPYDQLPQSFRDQVEKTIAEVRKQRGNAHAGGGKIPPP